MGPFDAIGELINKVAIHVKLIRDLYADEKFVVYKDRVIDILRSRNAMVMVKVAKELGDLASAMIQAAEEQGIIEKEVEIE